MYFGESTLYTQEQFYEDYKNRLDDLCEIKIFVVFIVFRYVIMPERGVVVPNDVKVGDQLFYPPKGNLLMEIIEIMDPLNWYNQTHTVKLVDVKAFERNNKQVEGMNFIYVYMEDAVTFLKREEKKDRPGRVRRLTFN